MAECVVFDTSILIDRLRTDRYAERMAGLTVPVRNSAVVLAELWRGASLERDRRVLHALKQNHPILTPTTANWLESGEVLGKMKADKGFEPHKLRDLHFDVLIALTARAHGARLITSNRDDFEFIRGYREFRLEVW
jgi:predicted nucleic acid-binding protein